MLTLNARMMPGTISLSSASKCAVGGALSYAAWTDGYTHTHTPTKITLSAGRVCLSAYCPWGDTTEAKGIRNFVAINIEIIKAETCFW